MPKSWCKKHHVKAGEELDFIEQGESLVVSPERNLTLPEITIDVRGLTSKIIWRYVSSVYRAGYDEFKLVFDNLDNKQRYSALSYNTLNFLYSDEKDKGPVLSPIEVIQLMVNRCIGVEIIDQKSKSCTIKELGRTTPQEFDNALRRIFLLLISLAEEVSSSVKKGNAQENLKSVHLIDTNIDRFIDFCIRVLNKKGYKDFRKTPTMHTILFLLELIGDEYKKIAIHLIEAKKMGSKMTELFDIQENQLKKYYKLFYKFNKEACLDMYEFDIMGHTYNREVYESLSSDEKEILHHLKKIGIYLMSLAELRVDLEY
ncbi:AbrB/MazE/SpoVT family DNA-binding domain-containing protein [archaeon]|nr:AbrB/MazE/SpoVT family DNA-binding domain-containing protein [archaeon]MBT3450558.1 AbrB/MazE/SpoVT family DNA-binding domain-containing protein [archaeon]MBT6868412.1 AbrB/MazE/SpoVT family DNA-binding domain-containing protein [archaeon]MBT7193511.1 AbrB/MazE/SpoVT family DNA-binding domain-containing protein [archaeon]MBT7381294.1 AbrB/MazE/SpoVT family DNA-binding domain-containing protein [archaeon]